MSNVSGFPESHRVPELFQAALAVQRHAYAPYSHFPVGAAILSPSGRIHAGCNVENAAYPVGSCAEAGAIAAMVAAGETEIVALLTICDSIEVGTCCGGCRQRVREFDQPEHPRRDGRGHETKPLRLSGPNDVGSNPSIVNTARTPSGPQA